MLELDKVGSLDTNNLFAAIDDDLGTHRAHGDPNDLADAIEAIGSRTHVPSKRMSLPQCCPTFPINFISLEKSPELN